MARRYNKFKKNVDSMLDFEGNSRNDVIDFEDRRKKVQNTSLRLKKINPKTENQAAVFDSYYLGKQQMLLGCAGTGKSFLSLYLMLSDLLAKDSEYEQLIIIRSAVQSRDQGFMPGNAKEKSRYFESPYYSIFTELFGRGDAYDILKNKGQVKFETTSFLRGLTYNNSLIFVDECQNMNFGESCTIPTRLGLNSRIIISGDYVQSDLNARYKEDKTKEDILKFISIIEDMPSFDTVRFGIDDIIRSGLCREFLEVAYKKSLI